MPARHIARENNSTSDDAKPQRPRTTSAASQDRATLERTMSRRSADKQPATLDHMDSNEPSSEDEIEEVKRLARQMTRATSTYSQIGANPWEFEPGSSIDPNSDNFRPRAFIKAMLNLQASEEGAIGRSAGLAFRNLSAHGYGAGTDVGGSMLNVHNLG